MTIERPQRSQAQSSSVFVAGEHEAEAAHAVPVWLVREGQEAEMVARLPPRQQTWCAAVNFTATAKKHVLLPGDDGKLAGVLFGIGKGSNGEPCGPSDLLLGQLPGLLPAGVYKLQGPLDDAELAATAWGLGSYRFSALKSAPPAVERARLVLPSDVADGAVAAVVDGIWLGRDLINLPAGDLGPAELEGEARRLARVHDASLSSIVGDELLAAGCGLIHAVGRASPREPRLIDITWGRSTAPKLTIVGKGICFDTGGLDLKPSSAMLLMKKDMGGAASALAAAHMIMALKLDVRLRVLLPIAENSVGGDAFRPGDVLRSRSGKTVEIGNTDAEGRLVLADALDLADEEAPDLLVTLATLTGAARVALGPDLPPMYVDDDGFAAQAIAAGARVGDPVWRMPLWAGYEKNLDSDVADMGNVSDGPFAGSITAALFLRRFVKKARRFAHFDIYGWRPVARPLGPKGGEPQVARLLLEVVRRGLVKAE